MDLRNMATILPGSAVAMSYYQDFSHCEHLGLHDAKLLAIGWLDLQQPYATGEVTAAFFESLMKLLVDPWQPAVVAGRHRCPFCRFSGGPAEVRYGGVIARMGTANLFIPYEDGVFAAPSLIAHYIDAHGYCPPVRFQAAVAQCPPMRSVEYLKQLRTHGVRKIGSQ